MHRFATRRPLRSLLLVLASALAIAPIGCAAKRLTLDAIYGPNKVDFSGGQLPGTRFEADGSLLIWDSGEPKRYAGPGFENGAPITPGALLAALDANPDFTEAELAAVRKFPGDARIGPDGWYRVTNERGIYVVGPGDTVARKIANQDEKRKVLQGPGKAGLMSFVRDNDLYLLDARTGAETRLTSDGSSTRLNGVLDWIYQEEIYGRGNYSGHWWSPSQNYIAFLQLDESRVPIYTVLDEVPPHPIAETLPYPKPGDPNPTVRLGIIRINNGVSSAPAASQSTASHTTTWVDLSAYANDEPLIVHVTWTPDDKLMFQVQERAQQCLDLMEADPATGAARKVLMESSKAWTNRLIEPQFLKDGTFLWQSERDGFKHFYHYRRSGELIRQLTSGEWEARDIAGVDEAGGWLYFKGTRDSSVEEHVYRVPLAGGEVQRLTEPGYSHSATFDEKCTHFVDRYSSLTQPPRLALRRADGGLVRMLGELSDAPARDHGFAKAEIVHPPTRDGDTLNAILLKPADYSPLRKYPVWCMVYGGPDSPQVSNSWRTRGDALLEQYLLQQGYVVWICDPRSASGRGAKYAWQVYRNLGALELRDIEDGVDWLVRRGIADPKRIGITGFSYGGYMTAYALTHSDRFKTGIAGGSVTDWRNYDSIYTERYMGLLKDNAAGYDSSSVTKAAANLKGRLLLVHGLLDENVHVQNSVELMHALQNAGKQFELMTYPRNKHGIRTAPRHYAELRLRFIEANL